MHRGNPNKEGLRKHRIKMARNSLAITIDELNMRKYILKSGQFVCVSSNYEDQKRKTMTVVIHSSGKVQSRIWARKLCLSAFA